MVVELDQLLSFDVGKAYVSPELRDPAKPVLLDFSFLDAFDVFFIFHEVPGRVLERDPLGLPGGAIP